MKLPIEVWICRGTNEYTEFRNTMMENPSKCCWYDKGQCRIGNDYKEEYGNRPRKCDARAAIIQWRLTDDVDYVRV